MLTEGVQPAVANEDSGISVNDHGGEPSPTTTTTTSGHATTIKRTSLKTEGIKVPTVTTKIKMDRSKLTTLCENLEGTLMQMVDDTREDDLFITRIQEQLQQSDENWEGNVTKIAEDLVKSKKELLEDESKKQIQDLKAELDTLRVRHAAAQNEKDDLFFKLRMKRVKIDQLTQEMSKIKEQMKDEQVWREQVERQLEAIQRGKVDTEKDQMATMVKVSNELFKYRNKRVPDTTELQDLHELVDRIHHNLGYLMVLGQQPNVPEDDALHNTNPEVEANKNRKPSISSAL